MNRRDVFLGALASAFAARVPVAVGGAAIPYGEISAGSALQARIEAAMWSVCRQYVGKPLTAEVVEVMFEAGNAVLEAECGPLELGSDGELYPAENSPTAIMGGRVWFEPGDNSPESIRAGHFEMVVNLEKEA